MGRSHDEAAGVWAAHQHQVPIPCALIWRRMHLKPLAESRYWGSMTPVQACDCLFSALGLNPKPYICHSKAEHRGLQLCHGLRTEPCCPPWIHAQPQQAPRSSIPTSL